MQDDSTLRQELCTGPSEFYVYRKPLLVSRFCGYFLGLRFQNLFVFGGITQRVLLSETLASSPTRLQPSSNRVPSSYFAVSLNYTETACHLGSYSLSESSHYTESATKIG